MWGGLRSVLVTLFHSGFPDGKNCVGGCSTLPSNARRSQFNCSTSFGHFPVERLAGEHRGEHISARTLGELEPLNEREARAHTNGAAAFR